MGLHHTLPNEAGAWRGGDFVAGEMDEEKHGRADNEPRPGQPGQGSQEQRAGSPQGTAGPLSSCVHTGPQDGAPRQHGCVWEWGGGAEGEPRVSGRLTQHSTWATCSDGELLGRNQAPGQGLRS